MVFPVLCGQLHRSLTSNTPNTTGMNWNTNWEPDLLPQHQCWIWQMLLWLNGGKTGSQVPNFAESLPRGMEAVMEHIKGIVWHFGIQALLSCWGLDEMLSWISLLISLCTKTKCKNNNSICIRGYPKIPPTASPWYCVCDVILVHPSHGCKRHRARFRSEAFCLPNVIDLLRFSRLSHFSLIFVLLPWVHRMQSLTPNWASSTSQQLRDRRYLVC